VVAVASEVADRHAGIGYALLDEAFDVVGVHGHCRFSSAAQR
jgi:hypothetical protein